MPRNDRAEKLREATLYIFGAYHSTHATYNPGTGQLSPDFGECTDSICAQTRDALAADRAAT